MSEGFAVPIYAYRCSACGHAQDVLQKISDPLLTVCPSCGQATYVKQVTAAGFQLKGSGWYATDFRNNGAAKPAGDDKGEGAKDGAKDGSKDGAKTSAADAAPASKDAGTASPAAAAAPSPAPAASPAAAPAPTPSAPR